MVELLEEAKLTAYASVLHDAGYSELTDLREADDVDLGELGLKKPEIKRLRRFLSRETGLKLWWSDHLSSPATWAVARTRLYKCMSMCVRV